ncbi:MAG: lysylphosphatidylglycerol synthase domain-containing protein [Planctomycetota bacterium]
MRRIRPIIKRVVQLVIQVGVLGFIGYYIVSRRTDLAQLLDLDLLDVVAVFALVALVNVVRSWELKYVLGNLDTDICFSESFYVTVSSALLNYLPNAGTLLKARILKKHRSLKYAHFVSVMGVTILITLLGGGILGLLAITVSGMVTGTEGTVLVVLFIGSIIAPLIVLHIPASVIEHHHGWVWTALRDLLSGWEQIRKNGRGLFVIFVLAMVKLLAVAMRLWICFRAVGTEVSLLGCIMFAVVSNLLMLINITPGSLGLRELLIGGIAQFTGFSFESGLLAASLDRVFALGFAVCGGVPSLVALRIKKMV